MSRYAFLSLAAIALACCLSRPASAQTVRFASGLNALQAVPASGSLASGKGTFTLKDDGTLQYLVTTCGLSGIEAHIHRGAPGVPGPIVMALAGGPTVWSGTSFVLSPAQESDLLSGQCYVDIHTPANPAGEIRGQIRLDPHVFGAQLDGLQQVPSNFSVATSGATVILNADGTLTYSLKSTGPLTAMAAHIHSGLPGTPGPIEVLLVGGPVNWSGTSLPLSTGQISELQAGAWYADVHSVEKPGGEIRGQLLPGNPCALFHEPFHHAASWTLSAPAAEGTGWAVDATPAHALASKAYGSPPFSLNFNNGLNFSGGAGPVVGGTVTSAPLSLSVAGVAFGLGPSVSGTATSLPGLVDLSGQTEIVLSFACNYQTQTTGTSVDRRFVEFSNNGFASANLGSLQLAGSGQSAGVNACAAMGLWHTHVVGGTLGAAAGANVQMRFRFDSVDAAGNGGAGWFVDDVKIAAGSPCTDGPCPCDDEAAPLDANGNPVLPAEATEVTDELIDTDMGLVEDLYPDEDTSLDLWYEKDPCARSIGEEPPPADATEYDLDEELAAAGITGASAEEIIAQLAVWEGQIADKVALEPDLLSSASVSPATGPYVTLAPHAPEPGECYVLGGRDLVFVHGLQIDHILNKITGDAGANTKWKVPTSFPGSTQNKEFYDADGYYKEIAVNIWSEHIKRFLTEKQIKNRYLIVPYSCAERLEVAAQSVLTQIGDAMRDRIGVVDPLDPLHPDAPAVPPVGPHDFGTPSFVIISHSTGAPVVDVALSVAASNPALHAEFIPQHCKAHIALHGALSGSGEATAAIVLSEFIGVVSTTTFPYLCPLVSATIAVLTHTVQPCPIGFVAMAQSILVDLVPLVMQQKWGDEIGSTPVRTVSVIGGHPSYASPIKTLLLPGFDDGVANINSQVANPNSRLAWPSGILGEDPGPVGLVQLFDKGVAQTGPNRAIFQFVEQVIDPRLQPGGQLLPILMSGGATPFVSATGMLQPVGNTLTSAFGGEFSTLNRYSNHFSFLQSASHHFGPNGSFGGFNGVYYADTYPFFVGSFYESNWEETRVLTDPLIYEPYRMPFPGDDEPLLTEGLEPKLHEVVRGRLIQFKLFGKKHRWWVWKRRYHLLGGAETLTEMDYVYRYLLTNPGVVEPCDPDWVDMRCSLAGVFGPPLLEGTGALVAGNTVALDLSNAAPSAPGLLFISVTSLPVPFKGGTLCAFPHLVHIGLFTNPSGNVHMAFGWPAVAGGVTIYAQMLVLDAAAVQGVAISNLVKGVTQ